jgi:hypothetical protein
MEGLGSGIESKDGGKEEDARLLACTSTRISIINSIITSVSLPTKYLAIDSLTIEIILF